MPRLEIMSDKYETFYRNIKFIISEVVLNAKYKIYEYKKNTNKKIKCMK